MKIVFSIGIEAEEYIIKVGDKIVGCCHCDDDPCNPSFWRDEEGEYYCEEVGSMGAAYSTARKLADAFEFASRLR